MQAIMPVPPQYTWRATHAEDRLDIRCLADDGPARAACRHGGLAAAGVDRASREIATPWTQQIPENGEMGSGQADSVAQMSEPAAAIKRLSLGAGLGTRITEQPSIRTSGRSAAPIDLRYAERPEQTPPPRLARDKLCVWVCQREKVPAPTPPQTHRRMRLPRTHELLGDSKDATCRRTRLLGHGTQAPRRLCCWTQREAEEGGGGGEPRRGAGRPED